MTEDSRAANQIRAEPIPPTPAHDDVPATGTEAPDTAADAGPAESHDRPQAGVPEHAVTDVTPALGTSEMFSPVEGAYIPDVGAGGADTDTDARPLPGRTRDSR